jgi:RNA polymerase sigma-70 factor (ECF subfamily)
MLQTDVSDSPTLLEKRLIRDLKKGEPRAFERMVHLHQDRVFGLCLRMMGDPEEAEDLAQEVFLTVFTSIRTFREESLLSTWIYRITRNHCLNRIKFLKRRAHEKKQSLEDTQQADLTGEDIHQPVASKVPRPDRLAEGKQLEVIIQEQIDQLTEEHRELIVLRDLEHLTYEEIQDITGLPAGTVKSRLHRARMELARLMAHFLDEK